MTQQTRPRSAAESMLNDLLTNHLDPGYAAAARRRADRAARGLPPARGRRAGALVSIVLLVAAGTLLGVAYHQQRVSEPRAHRTNAELIAQIGRRTKLLDSSQKQDNALRSAVTEQRAQALSQTELGSSLDSRLRSLSAATATLAVRGPGLVVTVGDGNADQDVGTTDDRPTGQGLDPSAVQDRDLQSIVNALWAAGAEAISINGQRLSSLSTIRAAGQAILVDFRPVLSPYSVRAIGPPDSMAAEFAGSLAARTFQTYEQVYGMTFTTRSATSLRLPAAAAPTLRYAHAPGALPGGGPSPSPGTDRSPAPSASPSDQPGVN